MGGYARLTLDGDDLFTLEMALTAYQQILEQYDDGKTALGGQYDRAVALKQRIEQAEKRIDG